MLAIFLSTGVASAQQMNVRANGEGRLIMKPLATSTNTFRINASVRGPATATVQQRAEIKADMREARVTAQNDIRELKRTWASTSTSTRGEMIKKIQMERKEKLQVLREERKDVKLDVYQQRVDNVIARLAAFADKQGALILKIQEKFDDADASINLSIGEEALVKATANIETIRVQIKSLDGVLVQASTTTKLATGKTIKDTALSVQALLKENQKLIQEALAVARANKLMITGDVNANYNATNTR